MTVRMHGLRIDSDDAARLVGTAIGIATVALDDAKTLTDAQVASDWLGAALRDARALGANVDQMCAWTELPADTIRELLAQEPAC